MPELIEIIKYKCLKCGKMHSKLSDAELCEVTDIFTRFFTFFPVSEDEWRAIEPKCSKPTEKWTAWSNFGLAKGW